MWPIPVRWYIIGVVTMDTKLPKVAVEYQILPRLGILRLLLDMVEQQRRQYEIHEYCQWGYAVLYLRRH